MEKRALIVVTNNDKLGDTGKQTGWYLSEVTHVYYPLVEAGFSVDFASPEGGKAPVDESSLKFDDPVNKKFVEDKNFSRLDNTVPLANGRTAGSAKLRRTQLFATND